MTFPLGVTLCELRLPASATWQGGASTITATVTPTRAVVHRPTSTPLAAVTGSATGPSGAGLVLLVPNSEQSNYQNAAGNSIASWEYDLVVTYKDAANVLQTVRKQVRIPRGTVTLDVLTAVNYKPDNGVPSFVADGTAASFATKLDAAVAATTYAAKSVETSKLDASQKGAASGVAPLDSGSRVAEANLPANLAATALNATYAPLGTLLIDGGNATSVYTTTFNIDGGSAA